MFGNDNQDEDIASVNPTLAGSDSSTPTDDATTPAPDPAPAVEPVTDDATPTVEPAAETPELPEVTEPAPAEETPTVEETPAADPAPTVDAPANEDDAELLELKKQALEELTPLIDQLDQNPEEKFKTTMMMIQATDSASLVKVAHETALKIEDEKVRAQALLDIVNEINYFTLPKE